MSKKIYILITLFSMVALLIACAPQGDPMAPYYPTHTAMAVEMEHMIQTATANAATAQAPQGTPTANTPTEGTAFEKLEDGSTHYTDYEAGYEIIVPTGWLALRADSTEAASVRENEAKNDPALLSLLDVFESKDPQVYRLMAADLKENVKDSTMLPNMIISWDPTDTVTLQEGLSQAISQIEGSAEFPSAHVFLANIATNPNHVEMLLLGFTWYAKNDAGEKFSVYTKVIIFKGRQGSLALTLMAAADIRQTIDPDFDALINSIKLTP